MKVAGLRASCVLSEGGQALFWEAARAAGPLTEECLYKKQLYPIGGSADAAVAFLAFAEPVRADAVEAALRRAPGAELATVVHEKPCHSPYLSLSGVLRPQEQENYRAAGIIPVRIVGGSLQLLLGVELSRKRFCGSFIKGRREGVDGDVADTAAREFWEETGMLAPSDHAMPRLAAALRGLSSAGGAGAGRLAPAAAPPAYASASATAGADAADDAVDALTAHVSRSLTLKDVEPGAGSTGDTTPLPASAGKPPRFGSSTDAAADATVRSIASPAVKAVQLRWRAALQPQPLCTDRDAAVAAAEAPPVTSIDDTSRLSDLVLQPALFYTQSSKIALFIAPWPLIENAMFGGHHHGDGGRDAPVDDIVEVHRRGAATRVAEEEAARAAGRSYPDVMELLHWVPLERILAVLAGGHDSGGHHDGKPAASASHGASGGAGSPDPLSRDYHDGAGSPGLGDEILRPGEGFADAAPLPLPVARTLFLDSSGNAVPTVLDAAGQPFPVSSLLRDLISQPLLLDFLRGIASAGSRGDGTATVTPAKSAAGAAAGVGASAAGAAAATGIVDGAKAMASGGAGAAPTVMAGASTRTAAPSALSPAAATSTGSLLSRADGEVESDLVRDGRRVMPASILDRHHDGSTEGGRGRGKGGGFSRGFRGHGRAGGGGLVTADSGSSSGGGPGRAEQDERSPGGGGERRRGPKGH